MGPDETLEIIPFMESREKSISTVTSSTARSCGASVSGKNIRAGCHYTQFMVYDLDGDGKAEVACKTAPGTIDGKGKAVLMGK